MTKKNGQGLTKKTWDYGFPGHFQSFDIHIPQTASLSFGAIIEWAKELPIEFTTWQSTPS